MNGKKNLPSIPLKKARERASLAAMQFVVGPAPKQSGTGRVIRSLPDDEVDDLRAECERLQKALKKSEAKLAKIGAILK